MLTLSQAVRDGRLREFVAQEEARGVGPGQSRELEKAIKNLAITPKQSGDRTSHPTSRWFERKVNSSRPPSRSVSVPLH
jgi:hypothetical protein